MSKTTEDLKKSALQIRNATESGENTAERIGKLFEDILSVLDDLDNYIDVEDFDMNKI